MEDHRKTQTTPQQNISRSYRYASPSRRRTTVHTPEHWKIEGARIILLGILSSFVGGINAFHPLALLTTMGFDWNSCIWGIVLIIIGFFVSRQSRLAVALFVVGDVCDVLLFWNPERFLYVAYHAVFLLLVVYNLWPYLFSSRPRTMPTGEEQKMPEGGNTPGEG